MKRIAILLVLVTFAQAKAAEEATNEFLIGVVEYSGGFMKSETVVTTKEIIKNFRFAVPKFCTSVEVLSAGTVSEGQYDEAQATSNPLVFTVNSGNGARIGKLVAELNGPKDLECSIPVYAMPSPMVTEPGPLVAKPIDICNATGTNTNVAFGFNDSKEWVAAGWWPLPARSCFVLRIMAAETSAIYVHAKSTDNTKTWGKGDSQFCVQSTQFHNSKSACEKGEGYYANFTRIARQADGVYRIDLVTKP